MKKWLFLALTAVLLLTLTCAGAENAMPETGDVVEGFILLESRTFPLIDAQVYLFEHEQTAAKLMYIANDDINRAFDLTFATVPEDNTGLPHVFEHATLQGSEKYPSKTLFFNLSFQSYNTFMNAMTFSHMTTFPVASLSEAQLLKLADFYTDSCFHPSIMTDESIYREEAWRYRLMGAEEPLTIEGTVYSEMLGSYTLSRVAALNASRDAFPGSVAGNDHGGDPDDIPDMTWDSLKAYHDRYYHPSNCVAFLYGELEDYTAFLRLLNEAFAPYEKQETVKADPDYTPLTAAVENSYPFGVEAGSPTDHVSAVYYTLVCRGADAEEQLVLNTMTDLFAAKSSALNQAIKDQLPSAQFACYISLDTPDPALTFCIENANPEEAVTFRALVDQAIAEVAANGFPQELVDSTEAALAIEVKLIRESASVGVESIIPNIAYEYIATGNPWDYMDYVEALEKLNGWNQEGRYAMAAQKYLLDSQATALTTTYAVAGLKEEHDAALEERLAEIKAAMTEEELAALVEASSGHETEEDASALVASLQAVDVSTLPEEVKRYDVRDSVSEAGTRFVEVEAGVSGVGQADIFLDAQGVAVEDLHYLKLLVDLVDYLDGETHTRAELASLSDRYLYGRNIRTSLLETEDGGFHAYVRLGWKAQDEDLAEGYELMKELFFGLKLEDQEQLLNAITSLKNGIRSTINSGSYQVILYRSIGITNSLYRAHSYMNYVDYYTFLEAAEARMAEDPEGLIADLTRVRSQMKNRTNALAMFCGSAESQQVNRPLAEAFLAEMGAEEIVPVSYDAIPVAAEREALIVESSVQFNLLEAALEDLGFTYSAELDAVASLVSDAYLMPLLRDQYGVYTPLHGFMDDHVYLLTYRDPNIAETYGVYEQLAELIADAKADQEVLNGYIMSAYSAYAMPTGELAGAVSAAISYLEGKDPLEAQQRMQELKTLTPEKLLAYAELYQALAEKGHRATSGGATAVNAAADRFDAILNPFGSVDTSAVTLADVPEEDPRYEAVRFAFDEGLMDAPEGVFSPDAPATAGDLAAALCVFALGSRPDGETAVATLTSYGLMPECQPGDAVTTELCDASLEAFCTAGYEIPYGVTLKTEAGAEMNRAELARALQLFELYLEEVFGAE